MGRRRQGACTLYIHGSVGVNMEMVDVASSGTGSGKEAPVDRHTNYFLLRDGV